MPLPTTTPPPHPFPHSREAERDARDEPLLSSFLYASILSHATFARALAFVLANRLADATLLATELMAVFETVLATHPSVQAAALADVVAVRERDPACASYCAALLYYKGYAAIQVHRIAHELWRSGTGRVMATALQSRVSAVFAVDIHPAAVIGPGFLLDHGTGCVIGETAVVGANVSILQNVTLGGTGKVAGDRHPKVGDGVLIGACVTVLGNIEIGAGAQVAAGSLVLRPVPPRTMVAGSPAALVGRVEGGTPTLRMQQWLAGLEAKAPSWEAALCGGGGGGEAPRAKEEEVVVVPAPAPPVEEPVRPAPPSAGARAAAVEAAARPPPTPPLQPGPPPPFKAPPVKPPPEGDVEYMI